ncbi:MAG: peptide ligase PGM1-related protein [Cyanobacteriota bacterium ELA615]
MYNLPERKESFKKLQSNLKYLWQEERAAEQEDLDILVVPSFSIDQEVGSNVLGFLHYEERLLFSLIRLRNPRTRLIYATAQPLPKLIVDYYLELLSGIPFGHARERLLMLYMYDSSFKPLTQKILERPRLIAKIKSTLRAGKSYMVCYNSTALEAELSLALDIPLLGCDPDLLYWGSKSGSREIFQQCHIPHPAGSLQINTVPDLIQQIKNLHSQKPTLRAMVVKLNEGISGEGNALLKIDPNDSDPDWLKSLEHLKFQAPKENWEHFAQKIGALGAIVEEYLEGTVKRSPSVQGYITPNGKVEIVSTHDQILGGPDGQIYLGCTFPADVAYRQQLQEYGLKIGQALAAKGAIESFAVDFVALWSQQRQNWDLYAVEINLRKGGTTHPFMTLQLLTNGHYDRGSGVFYSSYGQEKYYISTDNLCKPQYRGLLPTDLMDIIAKYRIHFDTGALQGPVFHMMGSLSEFGKLGLTCIGNSHQQAQEIYNQVENILDQETSLELPHSNSPLPISWYD